MKLYTLHAAARYSPFSARITEQKRRAHVFVYKYTVRAEKSDSAAAAAARNCLMIMTA